MKNLIKKSSLILTTLAFALNAAAPRALAHDSSSRSNATSTHSVNLRLNDLYYQKDSINLAGPRAGVGVSTVFLISGAMMAGAGGTVAAWDDFLETEEEARDPMSGGAKALIATGSVMAISGIIGLGISAAKLRANKKHVKQVNTEIQSLQLEQVRTSVSYGAPQKAAMVRF